MDFFCGLGTALAAAQRLGRGWIGVDSSETAINAAKEKLENAAPLLGAGFDVLRAIYSQQSLRADSLQGKLVGLQA